jgi:Ca2+-binding RTX toxin-like protein
VSRATRTRPPLPAVALLALLPALLAPLVAAAPAAAAELCGGFAATKVGTARADVIVGTGSRDVIVGLGGDDELYGLDGDDLFCGGPGDDVITGGAGSDGVSYLEAYNPVQADLSRDTATNDGQGTDDLIEVEEVVGTPYDDRIIGDQYDNRLVGMGGNDVLAGGAGADVLADQDLRPTEGDVFIPGAGSDEIYGGIGADVVDFLDITGSAGAAPVVVDLATGTATGQGNDVMSSVEGARGTALGDTVTGSGSANTIEGRGGNDRLLGGDGADTLLGGAGDDTLDGQAGTDRASFADATRAITADLAAGTATGDGRDSLLRIESLLGGPGADRLFGGPASDTLEGGPGNDRLDGRGGRDLLTFVSSPLYVEADLLTGVATGDATGTDVLIALENLRGSRYGDRLRGNDGPNTIVVGQGDVVEGRGGADVLDGGDVAAHAPHEWTLSFEHAPGKVTLDGTTGRTGGAAGVDTIEVSAQRIIGSPFSDTLRCDETLTFCDVDAGKGDDTIVGSGGDDRLQPGLGNDRVDGAAGTNQVTYLNATAPVTVDLATGRATGQGTDALTRVTRVRGSSSNDTITAAGAGCSVDAADGDDRVTIVGTAGCYVLGSYGNDTITGGAGPDDIHGEAGNDVVQAGAGNDQVWGDLGDDRLDGGAGTDMLMFYASVTVPVRVDLAAGTIAGLGTDTATAFEDVYGGSGADTIRGTDGPNHLHGYTGNDTIFGGGGDDWIEASGGNDWVDAGSGEDTIELSFGDDMAYGGDGVDTLSYVQSLTPVSVNLEARVAQGEGTDRFLQVENITGSTKADELRGDLGPNVIDGGQGTDACDGAGGTDQLINCP